MKTLLKILACILALGIFAYVIFLDLPQYEKGVLQVPSEKKENTNTLVAESSDKKEKEEKTVSTQTEEKGKKENTKDEKVKEEESEKEESKKDTSKEKASKNEIKEEKSEEEPKEETREEESETENKENENNDKPLKDADEAPDNILQEQFAKVSQEEMENGGAFRFQEINEKYSDYAEEMKTDNRKGILVFHAGAFPGDKNQISVEECKERVSEGWVLAIGSDKKIDLKNADMEEWESYVTEYLQKMSDMIGVSPDTYVFEIGEYNEKLDAFLLEHGIKRVLCDAESVMQVVDEGEIERVVYYSIQ